MTILEALRATIPDFVSDALCAQIDSEMWFPEKAVGLNMAREAKRVCLRCPVRAECAEYAITMPANPEGIWGATSMRERAKIRAERGIRDVHPAALDDKCGTEAGAKRHWRAKESACETCLKAARTAKADREFKAAIRAITEGHSA